MTLTDLIPDENLLLALPPEQVGKQLLRLASKRQQQGIFSTGSVAGQDNLFGGTIGHQMGAHYSTAQADKVKLAVSEAWLWLENALLIMPAAVPNHSGFKRLTRRGHAMVDDDTQFKTYALGAQFPKTLLHSSIADEVWVHLAQGKLAVAVFIAFRTVEERVREAANFPTTDIGVPMMRRAFHKDNGPLTRPEDPDAEKEALASLFAGAIGSYKNPHSHRTIQISDPSEAQEMVLLASHLLRIVDAREPKSPA